MKVLMKYRNIDFTYDCLSCEHGISLCRERYEVMGLIGRAYIYSSDGQIIQITN